MSKLYNRKWLLGSLAVFTIIILIYIVLSSIQKQKSLKDELSSNLRFISLRIEELALQKEVQAIPFSMRLDGEADEGMIKCRDFINKYSAIDGMWIMDPLYRKVYHAEIKYKKLKNHKPGNRSGGSYSWVKRDEREYLLVQTDIVSLFGTSMGKIIIYLNPQKLLSETIFNKFMITTGVPSNVLFAIPLLKKAKITFSKNNIAFLIKHKVEGRDSKIYLNNMVSFLTLGITYLLFIFICYPAMRWVMTFSTKNYIHDVITQAGPSNESNMKNENAAYQSTIRVFKNEIQELQNSLKHMKDLQMRQKEQEEAKKIEEEKINAEKKKLQGPYSCVSVSPIDTLGNTTVSSTALHYTPFSGSPNVVVMPSPSAYPAAMPGTMPYYPPGTPFPAPLQPAGVPLPQQQNMPVRPDALQSGQASGGNPQQTPGADSGEDSREKSPEKAPVPPESESPAVREMQKEPTDVKDFQSEKAEKTEADLIAEKALIEKMKLPDGKKTALIDDPTIPKTYVYDLSLGENIEEINPEMHKAPVSSDAKRDAAFTGGKTKMMESEGPKEIVYDDQFSESFTDINF